MARVLIVEDAPDIRYGLARLLALRGHVSACASDGLEAFSALRQAPADLVILDLAMPVMDGLTALQWMRNDPGLRDVPVLVYSAAGDGATRRRAEQLGADFVDKASASWQELAARAEQLLSPPAGPPEDGASGPRAPGP